MLKSFCRLLPFLVPATLVACGSEEAPDSAEDEVVVRTLANMAHVEADRLVFPKGVLPDELLKKVEAYEKASSKESVEPVILMADRGEDAVGGDGEVDGGSANPFGYLRRALRYENGSDGVTVYTETALLEEAIREMDESGVMDLRPVTAKRAGAPGLEPLANYALPSATLVDLAGTELYRQGDVVVTMPAATLTFDGNLDVGVDIGWRGLKEAHAIVAGNLNYELSVQAKGTAPIEMSISKQVFDRTWALPKLGVIPLSMRIVATVDCEITAAEGISGTFGAGGKVSYSTGFQYLKGEGMNGAGDGSAFESNAIGPTFETPNPANMKCTMNSNLNISVFDVIGLQMDPSVYGAFVAVTPPAESKLTAGAKGTVSGDAKLFGRQLGQFSQPVFDAEKEIWKGTLGVTP